MYSVVIKVHTITARVHSNDRDFIRYVEDYFNTGIATGDCDIDINLVFKSGFSWSLQKLFFSTARHLGENIVFNDTTKKFIGAHRELTIEAVLEKDIWRVRGEFQRNFFRHCANLLLFHARRDHYYRWITRLLIQNLIFMKLRERHSCAFASGAALAIGGRAFCFFGLPGSGKSTLVAALAKAIPGAEILAENYLVMDKKLLIPFPEGRLRFSHLAYQIAAGFIISRGEQMSMEMYSYEDACGAVNAINAFTAELPEHSILHTMAIANPLICALFKNEALEGILKNISIFSCVVDRGALNCVAYFKNTYAP